MKSKVEISGIEFPDMNAVEPGAKIRLIIDGTVEGVAGAVKSLKIESVLLEETAATEKTEPAEMDSAALADALEAGPEEA